MIYRGAFVSALVSVVVVFFGDGIDHRQAEVEAAPADWPIYCVTWADDFKERAGVAKLTEPPPGLRNVPVIIHLMLAVIDKDRRKGDFDIERPWIVAPKKDAVKKSLTKVVPKEPNTMIEYWTAKMLNMFFKKDGKVNDIWRQHGIELILVDGEDCWYDPGELRPDGLLRDSVLTPQTSTPWTSQFFRSVNRFFTNENPDKIHLLFWWSVAESDIDDVVAVRGSWWQAQPNNRIWGYSRSAARGGPAAWVGAWQCLTHVKDSPDEFTQGRCAKAIAHEVGHTFGLEHVDEPTNNLMFYDAVKEYPECDKCDKGVTLSLGQKQRVMREAREQFGSK